MCSLANITNNIKVILIYFLKMSKDFTAKRRVSKPEGVYFLLCVYLLNNCQLDNRRHEEDKVVRFIKDKL